jgi:type IV pilus assembly protein PilF
MELAVNYFAEGRTEIALDEIKQALVIDPQYAAAFNLRGLVLMRLGESRSAEDSFRRALSIAPRDGDTLHNLGWLQCQQNRFPEAQQSFQQALGLAGYGAPAKTLMAMGLCQARAGRPEEAERSLARSYELDAGNPVTAYNLARLMLQRGELVRAQFYIRRLNNSELANAESLWLGIRVERRLADTAAMNQLADQLRRRFPQSREWAAYERGAFDE